MLRATLLLAAIFFVLGLLRLIRIAAASLSGRGARQRSGDRTAAELVRDPICGTWVDRRLALTAARGGETISLCSEKCRTRFLAAG